MRQKRPMSETKVSKGFSISAFQEIPLDKAHRWNGKLTLMKRKRIAHEGNVRLSAVYRIVSVVILGGSNAPKFLGISGMRFLGQADETDVPTIAGKTPARGRRIALERGAMLSPGYRSLMRDHGTGLSYDP